MPCQSYPPVKYHHTIFLSPQAIKAHYSGDKTAATSYTRSARMWNIAAIVVGVIILNGLIQAVVRASITMANLWKMKLEDCNGTLTTM